MSRHVHDATITTPKSRATLAMRAKPYFRSIDPKLCIGYRKSKDGGYWLMRAYDGGGHYHQEAIGVADDHQRADGSAVLDYGQACKMAHDRYTRRYRRRKALPEDPSGLYKVKDAVRDYIQYLCEEKKSANCVEHALNAHITVNGLADLECDDLTTRILKRWRNDLAKMPRRSRSRRNGEQKYLPFDPNDPEQVRRRRESANINFSRMRAALNLAWRDGKVVSDFAWRRIKPFEETGKPRMRYLEFDEVARFLYAANGALRDVLIGGVVTGARPSELMRLEVRDYHDPSGTIHIVKSKIARERYVVLNEEGQEFFRRLSAGRKATERMFLRDNGTSWEGTNYDRPTKRAALDAGLDDVAFYTLRHTYCSHAVMNGMPLEVLAKNLGHVNTNMVQKHYGHLSKDFIAQQIRKHAPTFAVLNKSELPSAA